MNSFSVLADPNRLRIIEMLASRKDMAASEISSCFAVTPSAISQHLKVLKNAKLVRVKVKAQQRIYSLNEDAIIEIEQWVQRIKKLWEQRLEASDVMPTLDSISSRK